MGQLPALAAYDAFTRPGWARRGGHAQGRQLGEGSYNNVYEWHGAADLVLGVNDIVGGKRTRAEFRAALHHAHETRIGRRAHESSYRATTPR